MPSSGQSQAVAILTEMVRDGFARLDARLERVEQRVGELEKSVARLNKNHNSGRWRQWLVWVFLLGIAFAGGSAAGYIVEIITNGLPK